MKEKESPANITQEIFKLLTAPLFTAVRLRPLKGLDPQVETLATNPNQEEATVGENGTIDIPTGATARVSAGDRQLEIRDYRERPTHEPEAILSEDGQVQESLSKKKKTAFIPGVGYVKYYKSLVEK